MRYMSRRLRAFVAPAMLVLVLVGLAACKGKTPPAADLPAGDTLLKDSATAMRDVKSVRFSIESDGTVAGLALSRAGGQLTREGDAKGSAQVQQFGANVELEFVVVGDSIHIKGPTGGWQKLPLALASSVYDPSAILDPDRGIAKVISTASEGKTEAREKVDGVDAYRVSAKLNPTDLSAVVPGATDGVTGQLWVAADSKRLVRAKFALPGSGGSKGANVTVVFSEFDAPVTISAP